MPLLSNTNPRFTTPFEVIEGGSGIFQGILSEPSSGEMPASQFTYSRRQLQVQASLPVHPGMVVRDGSGACFLLADHGDSLSHGGVLYRSLRLFQVVRQYAWQIREMAIDPITNLEYDTGLSGERMIWGTYEPLGQQAGGAIPVSFEIARFVTGAEVKLDQLVDGKPVTRVDSALGVYLLTLG